VGNDKRFNAGTVPISDESRRDVWTFSHPVENKNLLEDTPSSFDIRPQHPIDTVAGLDFIK
jgi:hypothetical protein